MNKSNNNKNLVFAITVLGMAIIQAPLMFYYTCGMIGLFLIPIYALIGLMLSINLLKRTFDFKKNKIINNYFYAAIASLIIGIASFIFMDLNELDWKLRMEERNRIVNQVKMGKLGKANKTSLVKLNNFPPLSNCGNEIVVSRKEDQTIIVEFFIDRGFLDHYSSYIYTDNEAKKKELENRINLNLKSLNEKISENWYRVTY